MNKLQECQFEMLKKFIKVCEKYNLQYFLIGGSALGAVRHQGFIPWDDDIDVAMPRNDFNKFIKLQKEFEDPYFIQTYHSDKHYIYNFAKLRNSNTTYVENFFAATQMNHGVWIDIFPLDGISYKDKPAKKLAYKVKYNWFQVYLMYLPSLTRKLSWATLWKDIPLNIVAILFSFLNLFQYRNKLLDHRLTKIPYDKALLVANLVGTDATKQAMPREVYGKGSKGIFEGLEVNLPQDVDDYLKRFYGDYMKLPPKEKQIGHHFDKGISLDEGYLSYRKRHNQ